MSATFSNDDSIDKAFDEIATSFGKIDGLVHCIAHANKDELQGEYYNTSRDGYAMAQDISAYSLVAVTKRAVPLMTDGGCISTLSYLGSERAVQNYNVMGVAKAALEASVRYLATDVGGLEIRVNAISAGPVKTLAAKGVGDFSRIQERYLESSPMKRMATIEEIAGAAVFLASDLASGVTGEVLHVDCGYSISWCIKYLFQRCFVLYGASFLF